uniref:Uncharacterized protein n=1 Tax=Erpetoichthys calabaricus TaxID=27687 RepID=A0A8C4RNF3_ERPCA
KTFQSPRNLSSDRFLVLLYICGCMGATLNGSTFVYPMLRGAHQSLHLFPTNKEFPVSAGHNMSLIKSLSFSHTSCRYHQLDCLVRSLDLIYCSHSQPVAECLDDNQT